MTRVRRNIWPVLALALAAPAHAEPHFDRKDPQLYKSVADTGIALAIGSPGVVYIVKGKQAVKLAPADHFETVTIDKTAKQVTAVISDYTCEGKTKHVWTFGHLAARLENAAAFAMHTKKDFKTSAAGFARAVALDPTWKIAAYNLASAQQLAGDKAAAMKALEPHLATEPIATALAVARDPELAPLLDQPALVALRAAKPGATTTVTARPQGGAAITEKGLDGFALFAPDRGLVAITRNEASWGSMNFTVDIQVWDPANSQLVATVTVVEWGDTSPETRGVRKAVKTVVAERMTRVANQLAALGFRPAKVETGVETSDGLKAKVSFPKAKLGVVGPGDMANVAFKDGVANVLRKDTSLATAKITGRLSRAWFVEDASAVVIEMQRHSSEGCDGGDEAAFTVVKI